MKKKPKKGGKKPCQKKMSENTTCLYSLSHFQIAGRMNWLFCVANEMSFQIENSRCFCHRIINFGIGIHKVFASILTSVHQRVFADGEQRRTNQTKTLVIYKKKGEKKQRRNQTTYPANTLMESSIRRRLFQNS
jgi:hypothetical protein